jgi:formyltetrahydrofolate deformylase
MKSIHREMEIKNTAILLIYCPDKQGILAAVTEFLNENKGNIIYLDQHVDHEEGLFYMRVEWELEKFTIPREKIAEYFETLIARKYAMKFSLHFSDRKPRMAIFVSTMSHCLFDILSRYTAGEWETEIPLIISNHETLRPVAQRFGIDFHVFKISQENKAEQEQKELELLEKYHIDFVVLARYMQVLSEDFVKHYSNRIINIHHSFLPAFAGARPYHAAHQRGVKIIGATSHYITEDLDAGPIIAQDVVRISHIDTVESLIRKGRDLEKIVLSEAVYKHLQRKILVYNNRTVVFN